MSEERPDAPQQPDRPAGERPDAAREPGRPADQRPDAPRQPGPPTDQRPDAPQQPGPPTDQRPDAAREPDRPADQRPDAAREPDRPAGRRLGPTGRDRARRAARPSAASRDRSPAADGRAAPGDGPRPTAEPASRPPDDPIAAGARLVVDGAPRRVETVLRCAEEVGGVRTGWQWLFLDDGALLELSPRGVHRYDRHRVLDRAQPLYQQLLAQDGVFVRFEARVRSGVAATEPTYVTIDRREYVARATGTALIEAREGAPPALGAWSALGDDPAQNVWFLLDAVEGPTVALGLWTRGLCLSFGQPATLARPADEGAPPAR